MKEIILYLKFIKNGEAILSYEQVFNAKEVRLMRVAPDGK